MGDTISVALNQANDWALTLESGGKRFSCERAEPAATWAIGFFPWTDATDPRMLEAARQATQREAPAAATSVSAAAVLGLPPLVRGVSRCR